MTRMQVAPDMQPVVAALGQLFAGVVAAQGGQPAKKRELDDSSRRLGVLFWCAPGCSFRVQGLPRAGSLDTA